MIYRVAPLVYMGLVAAAGLLGSASVSWGQASSAPADASATYDQATPRAADGHPDLNGYWGTVTVVARRPGNPDDPTDAADTVIDLRNGSFPNLTNDNWLAGQDGEAGVAQEAQSGDDIPLYKPQYWPQVLQNGRQAGVLDPYLSCTPAAVPRIGAPTRIVQLPHEFIFWHRVAFQSNAIRDVPVGPPAYPPDPDGSWLGDPAAHWEGDTLVVETVGYNGQSWIGPQGWLHGYNLKTIERLHRQGNELTYDVTVEDPDYLQRPWVLPPQRVQLLKGHPFEEVPPCDDHDVGHIVRPNQG